MSQMDQIHFVNGLIASVKFNIIQAINDSSIPADWDGIELRRYIAYKFNNEIVGTMSKARKAEYENTIIVNNL